MSFDIGDLLLLPVLGPARLAMFVAECLYDEVYREVYDPSVLQQKLMEMRVLFELGEISEADYLAFQEQVEAQLRLLTEQEG